MKQRMKPRMTCNWRHVIAHDIAALTQTQVARPAFKSPNAGLVAREPERLD